MSRGWVNYGDESPMPPLVPLVSEAPFKQPMVVLPTSGLRCSLGSPGSGLRSTLGSMQAPPGGSYNAPPPRSIAAPRRSLAGYGAPPPQKTAFGIGNGSPRTISGSPLRTTMGGSA